MSYDISASCCGFFEESRLNSSFSSSTVNDSPLSGCILFPSSYPLLHTNGISKFSHNGHHYSKSTVLSFYQGKCKSCHYSVTLYRKSNFFQKFKTSAIIIIHHNSKILCTLLERDHKLHLA